MAVSKSLARALEATTVHFAPTASCACCDWTAPIGHPDIYRLALRHAETNVGHLSAVDTSRSRQYILREN